MLRDLESCGFATSLITINIGALCHWLPITHSALLEAFTSLSKAKLTTLLDMQSQLDQWSTSIVITASHQIFKARLDNN